MKVKLKEDPREWLKTTLLTALGLAFLSTVLRWRHILPMRYWAAVLVSTSVVALTACFRPHWYRAFYRISIRTGFHLSQAIAKVILALIFILLIAPLGLFLRLAGKDPLRLKGDRNASTYWHSAKEPSPLDRMF